MTKKIEENNIEIIDNDNEDEGESVHEGECTQPERRYPERDRKMPIHLENFVTDTAKSTLDYCYRISPPETYEEATGN